MLQFLMWIMNNFMGMQNSPEMQTFNQMMRGKTFEQQQQTVLNMAKSKGIDVNAKIFSEQDVKQLGLIK